MLKDIANKSSLPEVEVDSFVEIAGEYPVEAAQALQVTLGRKGFLNALYKVINEKGKPKNDIGEIISELVKKGANVIVSLNFTKDLFDIINRKVSDVILIRREQLSAWPDILHPRSDARFIALHGIIDPTSGRKLTAVLRREDYDQVQFSDLHYADFLKRLFIDFTVLSIGVSWKDIPLRIAASRARYSSPIMCRTHVALLPKDESRKFTGLKQDRWIDRTFVSSYSIKPILYDKKNNHAEAVALLDEISRLSEVDLEKIKIPKTLNDRGIDQLSQIANTIDRLGDYESNFQQVWFARNWKLLLNLLKGCSKVKLNFEQCGVASRLERHLRHFLWVYAPIGVRINERKEVWKSIARTWRLIPDNDIENIWKNLYKNQKTLDNNHYPTRGIFEFALGAFEVFSDEETNEPDVIRWRNLLKRTHSQAALRVEMAQKIWLQRTQESFEELTTLRWEALTCGWEAIEAKLVLDICENKFLENSNNTTSFRRLPDELRSELLGFAKDAREVARIAGCRRRELGAVALGSLIDDPDQGETSLIAVLRTYKRQTKMGAGPVGDWAIYFGLLAVLIDSSLKKPSAKYALNWLMDRCGKIETSNLSNVFVLEVITRYWGDYHPKAALLANQVANLLLNS